jgi:8-oxo-dGTP pyrophosphatase MutT (NUDIX family)
MDKQTNDRQPLTSTLARQIGAICMRSKADGPEVLMITTRETRRWMIPKGWPIDGLTPQKVAEREAWEEAGVIGKVKRKPLGEFRYAKILSDGREIEPLVSVYLIKVRRRKKRFPEMAERNVIWMKPIDAARNVREPDLRKLLLAVARRFGGSNELSYA